MWAQVGIKPEQLPADNAEATDQASLPGEGAQAAR